MEKENSKTVTSDHSDQDADDVLTTNTATKEAEDHAQQDGPKESVENDILNEDDIIEDVAQTNEEKVAVLEKEIARLTKEKNEHYDRLLRIQAEYDNYKKRTQKERAAERKYKAQDLANELLPVMDNFERALQVEQTEATKSMIEGISMVYNQLKEAMKSHGIKEIEAEGKPFDPNLHHAVMQEEDKDKDSNIVVEELQKGYILNDRVIRPAMVKVNK